MDFNELIHNQRGLLIKEIPKGAEVVLSAGCAGAWYFDWFKENYGPVSKHIGLELYSERPTELPGYVEWIANSVDNMSDVESNSVDLLFSGQNIEHLDAKTLLGFLKESNRVLRQGGSLVIDSPNRKVTTARRYIQPEHTLELTDNEIAELVTLAGFHVKTIEGIWNCRQSLLEPFMGPATLLPSDVVDVERRCKEAKDDPETSFIWWVVAEKTGNIQESIEKKVEEIYLKDFPGFVKARFSNNIGTLKYAGGTESIITVEKEDSGYVVYGPYIPVFPGKYAAYFRYNGLNDGGNICFDVVSNQGNVNHSRIDISSKTKTSGWKEIELLFDIDEYVTGLETRILTSGVKADFKFGSEILRLE